MSTQHAGPNASTAIASFLAGVFLGVGLLAPVVPAAIESLPETTALGPVGTVLVLGVVGIVTFVLGLTTLYLGFLFLDG
ncbi:MAG: hypothetical protein ABEJ74_05105 [Haloferacaceae archaeon]